MKIDLQDLHHTYRARGGKSTQALKGIRAEIQTGEFLAIIGPSGCGKSTLLRILAGLLEPTQGKAFLDGASPAKARAEKQIGWLAQNPALLPWRTVRSNVALVQGINPQNGHPILSADELLALVGLKEFAHAYPFTLSGGMQQRVALARTLALGASVWLMDEPFAALDELTREALTLEMLALWKRFHPTVIWVTHHIYEAVRLADRVLVMTTRPGRIADEVPVAMPRPRIETRDEFRSTITRLRTSLGLDQYAKVNPLA
jgi:NitT/TauT family transport system ATP-binding protein